MVFPIPPSALFTIFVLTTSVFYGREEVCVLLSTTEIKQNRSLKCSDRQHALVIGASMAGLVAARILSDYFELVTVLERDQLPTHAEARKGVPQGRHVNLLMCRGADIIWE